MKWHDGGVHKPLALDAFDKALECKLQDDDRFTYLHYKGILLKMMGKGQDAIDTHKQSLSFAPSKEQKSKVFVQLADARSMMGDLEEAVAALKSALKADPSNLEAFYPLVESYKELGNFTRADWIELSRKIEKKVHNNGRSTVATQDRDATKELDFTKSPTSAYWALFEAWQKAGDLDKAWAWLEVAHSREIAVRQKGGLGHMDPRKSYTSVAQVFREGFWSDPSYGSESQVPIFIVGMMS